MRHVALACDYFSLVFDLKRKIDIGNKVRKLPETAELKTVSALNAKLKEESNSLRLNHATLSSRRYLRE
jgi:hypothetical protein